MDEGEHASLHPYLGAGRGEKPPWEAVVEGAAARLPFLERRGGGLAENQAVPATQSKQSLPRDAKRGQPLPVGRGRPRQAGRSERGRHNKGFMPGAERGRGRRAGGRRSAAGLAEPLGPESRRRLRAGGRQEGVASRSAWWEIQDGGGRKGNCWCNNEAPDNPAVPS